MKFNKHIDIALHVLFCCCISMLMLYLSSCTRFNIAKYATPACDMACSDLELATVDSCHSICDHALAGTEVDLVSPCYMACEEAVITGKSKCVDACEIGVVDAIEAFDRKNR